MQITHKQHYVQKAYLRKWEDRKKLWIYDLSTKKELHESRKKVCFEIDFYKMYRLTNDEKYLFSVLYKDVPPELKKRINEFNNLLDFEVRIEASQSEIQNAVTTLYLENQCKIENDVFTQAGEDLLCDIEDEIPKELWDRILSRDTTLIQDDKIRVRFYSYLICQIWRVPYKKTLLKNILEKMSKIGKLDVSVDRMFPYFVYHQSMLESYCMSITNKHKLSYLIINQNSPSEFITSDNPIINLCHEFDQDGAPKYYELYWAISPKLALLITTFSANDSEVISENQINNFNKAVYNNAYKYIIAKSQKILSEYSLP